MTTFSKYFSEPLLGLSNESIFYAIMDEHPQTMAVILSCLPSSLAADIIEKLPPERQLSVLRRMITLRRVEAAVVYLIEKELVERMAAADFICFDGFNTVVDVLIAVDKSTSNNILSNLAQGDPYLVEEIQENIRIKETIKQLATAGKITINDENYE